MGCDVWIEWDGMTPEEEREQHAHQGLITGGGKFGVLRGPQGFRMCSAWDGETYAPAPDDLRADIPGAVRACLEKYGCPDEEAEYRANLNDFCDLYERKHAEGKNPRVLGSW